ncbi:MAG: hypothetical protein NE327_13675, partial [Lentisphaeraceae bacterium]|nr:hypothetical protein [Lentisphaeraceae bacterium]
RFELSPTGYFTGTLRVIKKGGQEDIKFSGQTIEITNKNDLIAQNRKYEKFIRYRITESPMKRVRQIISTPVSLSLDATGTAIVSAAGVILFPVIVFSGVGRWKM